MDGAARQRVTTRGWRIALRGLSDTLENLLPFTIASLTWWLGVVTLVFAPAATRALFQAADPRIASSFDRPAVAGAFRRPLTGAGGAWRIGLVIALPVFVLLWNLRAYSNESTGWTLLIPLWLLVLVCLLLIGLVALSLESLLDMPAGQALRLAAALVLGQPLRLVTLLLIPVPVVLVGTVLVVPLFTLLPAAVAAITNRFALASLGMTTADPLAPTGEREREEAVERSRAEAARRFGP